MTLEERKKSNARCKVAKAIKDGLLERKPCGQCGGKGLAHHDDYDKPLEVRWLCRSCHHWHHFPNGRSYTDKQLKATNQRNSDPVIKRMKEQFAALNKIATAKGNNPVLVPFADYNRFHK